MGTLTAHRLSCKWIITGTHHNTEPVRHVVGLFLWRNEQLSAESPEDPLVVSWNQQSYFGFFASSFIQARSSSLVSDGSFDKSSPVRDIFRLHSRLIKSLLIKRNLICSFSQASVHACPVCALPL